MAPVVPHPLAGRGDCLACHAAGKMKPFPADHTGRANQTCAVCHDAGAGTISTVPHPTKGREDCLACHAAGKMKPFPSDHSGRTNPTCAVCHDPGAAKTIPMVPHPTKGREDCLACHAVGEMKPFPADHKDRTNPTCAVCHDVGTTTAPTVPHPLAGRGNCLACHAAGEVKPFPADHTGRTNLTCAVCHDVAAGAIPTIPHPTKGRADCLTCHDTGKMKPFPADHKGRTNSTCAVCHDAGTLGTIPIIPHPIAGGQDCLACHDTGEVKPFPADHKGRTSVSCIACHDVGANTLASIPNVPHPTEGREDCLACHYTGGVRPFPADHAGRTSDSCLGCHTPSTTASAVPPVPHPTEGREDCLACHDTGGMRPFPTDHAGRTSDSCLGCHQAGTAPTPSVDVVPTPIQEPELFADNSCVTCHEGLGGKSAQITADWKQGVHAGQGVGCVSCHGGDPNQADMVAAMSPEAGFLGVLAKSQIPGLCGSCHSRVDLMRPYDLPTDQFDQYWQSQHGRALLQGDQNVATCFDCHDGHKVTKVKDPGALVYPNNEPAMCARCHADATLMASYVIPADQYDLYQKSVHGVAVLQNQDQRAPTCSTCHGKHGAAPPGYSQVANVCGQCHSATEEYYLKGAHRTGMTGQDAPGCATCHGQHDVTPPTLDLFLGTQARHCGSCHQPGSTTAGQVDAIYQALKAADDAYTQAEVAIAQGSEKRLIMTQQEETLQKANTPLIEARALQHTVSLADIQAKAEESVTLSDQARTSAEEAVKGLGTRYIGMAVALGVILVTVVALVLIKRELDRNLEAQRARRRGAA